MQIVRLARELGLVKLGTIAMDGTKVTANASRHKAMSYGYMLKWIAEPLNGWIKNVLGFRQSNLRGLRRVGAEW